MAPFFTSVSQRMFAKHFAVIFGVRCLNLNRNATVGWLASNGHLWQQRTTQLNKTTAFSVLPAPPSPHPSVDREPSNRKNHRSRRCSFRDTGLKSTEQQRVPSDKGQRHRCIVLTLGRPKGRDRIQRRRPNDCAREGFVRFKTSNTVTERDDG